MKSGMRSACLVVLTMLAGCGSEPDRAQAPALPDLQTYTVRAEGADGGRAWDGVVEAVQQATLSAQTAGRVTAVDVDVDDRVAAGQVLLRITAFEQRAGVNSAQAQLRAAEAAAKEAELNYRRFASLAESQYVSRAQLDQARAMRDSATAMRDAAGAQLAQALQQTEYTVVRAPFAGIVDRRDVEPGETVAAGRSLIAVHAPGALRIEVLVPQSDAAAIRARPHARIVLTDGRSLEASRVVVFPAADPASHSIGVRVMLPALDDAPAPGTTAKIVLPMAGGAAAAVKIPAAALVQRGEVSGVYVVKDGRLALRQVRIGQRIGDQVEVVAGLHAGESVAVDPVAALQALAARRKSMDDA